MTSSAGQEPDKLVKHDYVVIKKDAYEQLKEDSYILQKLYAAGVENWDYYYDAINEK